METKVVELVGSRSDANLGPAWEFLRRAEGDLNSEDCTQGSLDLRFETILASIARNPLLARVQGIMHRLWITSWGGKGIAPGDRRSLHREHVSILRALEEGKVDLAIRRMVAHVDRRVREAVPRAQA